MRNEVDQIDGSPADLRPYVSLFSICRLSGFGLGHPFEQSSVTISQSFDLLAFFFPPLGLWLWRQFSSASAAFRAAVVIKSEFPASDRGSRSVGRIICRVQTSLWMEYYVKIIRLYELVLL